jgi:DNA primase
MDHLRLHPDTIEAVKQRADIVDVVSEQVVLKKQGKDLIGFCPFHDDKNKPSFTVSPSKQFYYCFSCNAGGNAITFLMEIGKSSFTDVVLGLAQRYDVPVQTLEPEKRQEIERQLSLRETLYEILAVTAKFYEHSMHQPEGAAALAYLRDQRGFSDTVIQQFQLGYSPGGWTPLYNHLVEQKGYSKDLVEKAGLIVKRKTGDGYYDRFRDRLMIPIRDIQSRVIAFGGRTLSGEDPKYLNSPETELFDKGQILFALDQARTLISKQDRAVVVEGYFDVIALHAVGITNVVASLGTALSQSQVKLLLRYTESKRIVLNFDADRAGTQAAERAIGEVEALAYQGQVELRLLNLPGGKDADEFLKQFSPAYYQDLLVKAPLWIDWQIQRLIGGRDLKQADIFQTAIQGLVKLLGNLPNTPIRTHYIHHCAEMLSQGEARVALQLEDDLRLQVRGQRWHGKSKKWERPGDYTTREIAEAQLLQIYLHCPAARLGVRSSLRSRDLDFGLFAHRLLWKQILQIEEAHLGADTMADPDRLSIAELATIDLLNLLRDGITDVPREATPLIMQILYLDEMTECGIRRPLLVTRAAVATLERINSEKRSRHLLDAWARQSILSVERCVELLLETGMDPDQDGDAQIEQLYSELNAETYRFQKLFYDERRYLDILDQQRRASFDDILQSPV